jgi:hypothetical protein
VSDLRELVSDLMVRVHQIPHVLADYHVAGMTDAEIEFRLQMYSRLQKETECKGTWKTF